MTSSDIKIFLPVFLVIFTIVFLVWNYTFKKRLQKSMEYHLSPFNQINHFFQVMLGLAAVIVGFYAFIPEYYLLLIPIDSLDKPFINDLGGFILRIALFWLVSAMIHTYLLFQNIKKKTSRKPVEIYAYAQKIVLVSIALMLVGLAVTISSVGAFLLSLIGLFYYHQVFQKSAS
jgi:uncharacterized membrane protein YidH (DUF202 family)